MKLNNITLDERTEKALRLRAKQMELEAEIKAFVGEANCDHNGDGTYALRDIASKGVIIATQQHIKQEEYERTN